MKDEKQSTWMKIEKQLFSIVRKLKEGESKIISLYNKRNNWGKKIWFGKNRRGQKRDQFQFERKHSSNWQLKIHIKEGFFRAYQWKGWKNENTDPLLHKGLGNLRDEPE